MCAWFNHWAMPAVLHHCSPHHCLYRVAMRSKCCSFTRRLVNLCPMLETIIDYFKLNWEKYLKNILIFGQKYLAERSKSEVRILFMYVAYFHRMGIWMSPRFTWSSLRVLLSQAWIFKLQLHSPPPQPLHPLFLSLRKHLFRDEAFSPLWRAHLHQATLHTLLIALNFPQF